MWKRAVTDLEFFSWFFIVVLTCLFADFVSTGSCLVWTHPKMGTATFDCFYIVMASVHSCLYLVTSPSQLSNPSFFLVIFNYRDHSPVTGWSTTSALAWLTGRQIAVPYTLCLLVLFLLIYFFLLSLLPQKFISNRFLTSYHVTQEISTDKTPLVEEGKLLEIKIGNWNLTIRTNSICITQNPS